jgi:hypothetical protein
VGQCTIHHGTSGEDETLITGCCTKTALEIPEGVLKIIPMALFVVNDPGEDIPVFGTYNRGKGGIIFAKIIIKLGGMKGVDPDIDVLLHKNDSGKFCPGLVARACQFIIPILLQP